MFEADPPGTTGLYRYSSVFCSMYRPAMSTTFIFRYASLAWLLHFRSNEPCQAATASLAYVVSHSTIASWSGTSASGPVSVDARRRLFDQISPPGRVPPHWARTLSLIHISEPTRQAEISYAVFCLKKKKKIKRRKSKIKSNKQKKSISEEKDQQESKK